MHAGPFGIEKNRVIFVEDTFFLAAAFFFFEAAFFFYPSFLYEATKYLIGKIVDVEEAD